VTGLVIIAAVVLIVLAFKVRGELRDLQRDGIISGPRSRSVWGRWKRRRR